MMKKIWKMCEKKVLNRQKRCEIAYLEEFTIKTYVNHIYILVALKQADILVWMRNYWGVKKGVKSKLFYLPRAFPTRSADFFYLLYTI